MKKVSVFPIYVIMALLAYIACDKDEKETYSLRSETSSSYDQNQLKTKPFLNSIQYNTDSSGTYERFKIVHISDIHISKWTTDNLANRPNNLIEAVQFANTHDHLIDIMVATGDFIEQSSTTDKKTASNFLKSFVSNYYTSNNIPSFACTGNHDSNKLTDNAAYHLNTQEIQQILFSQNNYPLQRPTEENYYYTDIDNTSEGKIRIIALDNTDVENIQQLTHNLSCITQKQINWFVNTALKENMTSQHHVIILNHHPYQPYSKNQSTYMCSGTHLYSEKLIPDIVNAFIKKEQLNKTYSARISSYQPIRVEADFTHATGEFVCHLGGHTHTFGLFDVECSDKNPSKQIMLLGNTLSPERQNKYYQPIQRTPKSINSNSFSIYAVDTKEKKIYRTFFGAAPYNKLSIDTIPYQ